MKAGIYQCYDGTLLYIAKDRTIKAFTSHVIHDEWTGEALSEPADLITVTTANREQLARFTHNGRTVEAKRLDNVPNGCTDHLRALSKVSYSMLLGPIADHTRVRNQGEHLLDYIYAVCGLVCVLDALIGTPKKCLLKADCSMCAQSVCDECGPATCGGSTSTASRLMRS